MNPKTYLTLWILSILFVLNPNLLAQGDIRGSVKMFPADDIQVALINQHDRIVHTTTTDDNGNYYFRYVSAGNYKLRFSCDYIRTSTTNIFYVPASGIYRRPDLLTYNNAGLITFFYCTAWDFPDNFPGLINTSRDRIISDRLLQHIDRIAAALDREASRQPSRQQMLRYAHEAGMSQDDAEKWYSQQPTPALMAFYFSEISQSIRQILTRNTDGYYRTQIYREAKNLASTFAQLKEMHELFGGSQFVDFDQFLSITRVATFHYTFFYANAF